MTEQNFEAKKPAQADQDTQTPRVSQPRQVQIPDISGILDQIDAVLEKNSEEFVNGFVQKGGQ